MSTDLNTTTVAVLYDTDLSSAMEYVRTRGREPMRRDDGSHLTEEETNLVLQARPAELRAAHALHERDAQRREERIRAAERLHQVLCEHPGQPLGEVRDQAPPELRQELDQLLEFLAPDGWLYLDGSDA